MIEPLLLICIIGAIALLLFAIEAFVTPGFGVAGIGATICVVIADAMIYFYYDNMTATLALIISTIVVLAFIWLLTRPKTLDKMSLKTNIDSTNATKEQLSVRPGQEGVAMTRLALIGNADIDGHMVEVKSTGQFINEGTPIVVVSVSDALILVKPKD